MYKTFDFIYMNKYKYTLYFLIKCYIIIFDSILNEHV